VADPDFEIGRGRIYPSFQAALSGPGVDSEGKPVVPDYSGWTVRFHLLKDGVTVFDKAAEWVDPTTAVVRYRWEVTDTDRAPGRYEGKVLVFDPDGNPGPVYPSNRYHSIRIEPI